MAKLDDFKKKVQQTYVAGDLGMLESWAAGYSDPNGRQYAATYADQLRAAQATAAATATTAAGQQAAAVAAPQASKQAQAAGEAEAGRARMNTGRRAMVANRLGALGLAQEYAKTRKTKLGA